VLTAGRRDESPDAGEEPALWEHASPATSQDSNTAMSAKLSPAQVAQLEALAKLLDRGQALWVSGYFAGLAGIGGIAAAGTPPPLGDVAPATTAITILFGSETGNGAGLARDFASRLQSGGVNARAVDMDSYKVRGLKEEQTLLVVTSTHGEGDPPQSALGFFEFIEGRKAPKLAGLKFAVLALGDSTYEKYCEAGKRLDRRLEELGATRLVPRIDCDVDYEVPAAQWMASLQPLLPKSAADVSPIAVLSKTPQSPAASQFDKRNPFDAPIIENLVLTGRGSSKETRHVEFSLAGSGITYEPGDALGLLPLNDIALVDAILAQTGLNGDMPVSCKAGQMRLAHALTSEFEIVAATPRFLEAWAAFSGSSELQRLVAPESAAERNAYLHQHHVIDMIRAFPVPGLKAEDFMLGLRPLQPRLYSIASSLAAVPDEVHLTIATVRYELHGEPRAGVASGYMAARAEPDSTLPVYVQANPHFRLPADDASIIMIGAGTGVAPYRAFLQEREARGAIGRSWLFFGERNFRSDFLYQLEWQEHLKSGLLTRMDVAFSRDRAEKVYVQNRLKEKAAELYAWLEEGAHLYVCGDAAHMAPDVHAALLALIQDQGHVGPEAAEDYLRNLQRDHRYQRDVY
jgi:sulfite reductase (NADPH) flavoprotein alpha-component